MYGSSFCIRTREAALFEQHADRRAGEPFAERADDATGDENVFGHGRAYLPGNDDPVRDAECALREPILHSNVAASAEASPWRIS